MTFLTKVITYNLYKANYYTVEGRWPSSQISTELGDQFWNPAEKIFTPNLKFPSFNWDCHDL